MFRRVAALAFLAVLAACSGHHRGKRTRIDGTGFVVDLPPDMTLSYRYHQDSCWTTSPPIANFCTSDEWMPTYDEVACEPGAAKTDLPGGGFYVTCWRPDGGAEIDAYLPRKGGGSIMCSAIDADPKRAELCTTLRPE